MTPNFTKSLIIFLFLPLLWSCEQQEVSLKLLEIDEDQTAVFELRNRSQQDIENLRIEFIYFSAEEEQLKVDTVDYAGSDAQVFLEAGEKTWLSQTAPVGTTSALGHILKIEPVGEEEDQN